MVQLRTRNIALALYGVLLVLPTAVLGGLQWYDIVQAHQAAKAAVPQKADDAARRLQEMVADRLHRLVDAEDDRPVTHYAPNVLQATAPGPPQPPLLPSPLRSEPAPRGILTWFVFDQLDGAQADVDLFFGSGREVSGDPDRIADLNLLVHEFAAHALDKRDPTPFLSPMGWKSYGNWTGPGDETLVPLAALAVAHGRENDYDACVDRASAAVRDQLVAVNVTPFELRFVHHGERRFTVASRRVIVRPDPVLSGGVDACIERFSHGMDLIQGFVLDPDWLFNELPVQVARSVLDPTQRFVSPTCEDCCKGLMEFHYHSEIRLVKELDLAADEEDQDYALMKVAVDTGHLEHNFRSQAWRYFGMAGMLTLSLATGLLLLLRSVNRDLEQARRTENFVASVTHELRTPLSAIKLHGEMLLDGWAPEAEKRQEYYRRIVRETSRLSTLVERVLEKSRLSSAQPQKPVAMDLNDRVLRLKPHLDDCATTQKSDLSFELAEDLPEVLLTNDALGSILVNLVENARKYAPVDVSSGGEPILVRTSKRRGKVVLEVSDRGPGIGADEKEHVFEAFYRVGNEQTRTAQGTGLGLHLVAIQAEAIHARVKVEDRAGGGTTFRVTFATA